MDIKILDLADFDINEYGNDNAIDINLHDENGIYFSYPYYSHNDIDYQYRFTFKDEQVIIDEIVNDNCKEFDNITLSQNVGIIDMDKFNEYLSNLIDFRDGKTILKDGIINLNLDILDSNSKFNLIKNNKTYVLYE